MYSTRTVSSPVLNELMDQMVNQKDLAFIKENFRKINFVEANLDKTNNFVRIPEESFDDSLQLSKEILDPIHYKIPVTKLADSIINTIPFQSLRDKKQLGACFMYIPSAVHDRFTHSLGVYFLAKKVMYHFRNNQPELEISQRDIEIVGIAGLVHDLGHGPYSHMFETFLKKTGHNFSHEDMSIVLLKHIIKPNKINISDEEINKITCMIKGNIPDYDINRAYMYQIVCNKDSGIDVDKFDYIQRDCYFTGHKYMFNATELISSGRIINGQICYPESQIDNIYELFRTRFLMFKYVYMNGINKGIELMIMDIISKLGSVINIPEHINDPERYCKLTDNYIISLVEYFSGDKLIREASEILNNLRLNKIYTIIVEEKWLLKQEHKHVTSSLVVQEILKRCDNIVKENDIRISIFDINFGKNKKNPLKYVHFYNNYDFNTSYKKTKFNNVLIPSKVSETTIRIFLTDPYNDGKKNSIINAYKDYVKTLNL